MHSYQSRQVRTSEHKKHTQSENKTEKHYKREQKAAYGIAREERASKKRLGGVSGGEEMGGRKSYSLCEASAGVTAWLPKRRIL